MNVALLFNSSHPSLGSWSESPVMERILRARVLQKTNRYLRVSVGDVLSHSAVTQNRNRTKAELIQLCRSVYQPKLFDRLIRDRLDVMHGEATVFCWLFQNMTTDIAEDLNVELHQEPWYLGMMDVDFANPIHLQLFRNWLPELYRIHGNHCAIFYSMGENEDPDIVEREIFERHGFVVEYEDSGARRTIFDNYDGAGHFKRVDDFCRVFGSFSGLSADEVSDLVLMLEELHPKLFDAFASAARAIERAETEEDLAQAALSGRRLMEAVAEYLFPARDGEWNGRKIGKAEYKNRLWAYIEQTIADAHLTDSTLLLNLGGEVDRLVKLFNSGLHAGPTRKKVQTAFCDLVIWLTRLILLSPKHARRAYLAYEEQILNFFREVVGNSSEAQGASKLRK